MEYLTPMVLKVQVEEVEEVEVVVLV